MHGQLGRSRLRDGLADTGPVCCPRDLARFSLVFPVSVRYAAYVSNWAWVLFGGATTLAAAVVVVLWQAFKHLDLKIERLDDKIDKEVR